MITKKIEQVKETMSTVRRTYSKVHDVSPLMLPIPYRVKIVMKVIKEPEERGIRGMTLENANWKHCS